MLEPCRVHHEMAAFPSAFAHPTCWEDVPTPASAQSSSVFPAEMGCQDFNKGLPQKKESALLCNTYSEPLVKSFSFLQIKPKSSNYMFPVCVLPTQIYQLQIVPTADFGSPHPHPVWAQHGTSSPWCCLALGKGPCVLPATSQLEWLLRGLSGSRRCSGQALFHPNVLMSPVPSGSTFIIIPMESTDMKGRSRGLLSPWQSTSGKLSLC